MAIAVTPDPARVLLVEDEAAIREPLSLALRGAGYAARALPDGAAIESELDRFRPDLAILDVMLPGADGFALARQVRRRGEAPIVFLTGRDELSARLRGFEAGGDDYVVKPFLTEELLARIRALLRRCGRGRSPVLELGTLLIDSTDGTARRDGRELALTATELALLDYLARHRDRVVSKLALLTAVWGYEAYDPNVVEVHVSALRRKLGPPDPIETLRGRGYRLRA